MIIDVVENINNYYSQKSQYQNQKLKDFKNGLVKIRNIYIPLKSISHRILFEEYELSLISTFLIFYKNLFLNIENILTQFSIGRSPKRLPGANHICAVIRRWA